MLFWSIYILCKSIPTIFNNNLCWESYISKNSWNIRFKEINYQKLSRFKKEFEHFLVEFKFPLTSSNFIINSIYLFIFQWKCYKIDQFADRIFTKTSRLSEKLELPKRCCLGINFVPRFESVCRIRLWNRIEINSIGSVRLPNSNCRKSSPMRYHKSSYDSICHQIRWS